MNWHELVGPGTKTRESCFPLITRLTLVNLAVCFLVGTVCLVERIFVGLVVEE